MKIESIMNSDVICVDMDDRLYTVRELFINNKFHHLMVIDHKKELVAIISDRDYFKATNTNIDLPSANEKDLATLNKRVHQIVSKKLVAVKQFSSYKDAIIIFHDNKISCLPVVNAHNQPVGIVTWRDIMSWLYAKTSSPKES
jgi:acetoin utilization protein AcuB